METFQSPPHPALEKFIAQYLFLSLDNAMEFGSLQQVFFPIDICGLAFFSDKLRVRHPVTSVDCIVPTVYTGLTTAACSISFPENQPVEGFIIVFKPTGFSDLFRLDNSDATNYFPDFFSIKAKEGKQFYDQIMETPQVREKIKIADTYFLKKIPKQDKTAQLREACVQIIRNDGAIAVRKLAYHVNMSLSSFERNFSRKVGVTPKMFARFKRFHRSLALMESGQTKSYTEVAYRSGYYDQAHFIKEFEAFTERKPSSVSMRNFPLYSQLILNRNYYK